MANKIEGPRIDRLYIRPDASAPPHAADELILSAGLGIKNDCHADLLSSRQVLIAFDATYHEFNLPAASLRENILVSNHIDEGELRSGDVLFTQDGAKLRLMFACEPCGRLNKVRTGLCGEIKGKRGYLARVVGDGTIRLGDRFFLTKEAYPPFSDDWHERVLFVARQLPANHFLSYTRLASLAGVAKTYCRAFPRLLQSHSDIPSNRILSTDRTSTLAALPEWDGTSIFAPEALP